MPIVLLGGIYSGVTTPTEAAALAAAYALLISVVLYRSVNLNELLSLAAGQRQTTASIGMLIAGAIVFNYVVTLENIPNSLAALLRAMGPVARSAFLMLVNVILLMLGCVLEGTTILLIVVPVLIPTAKALGIDLVHFGVVVVVNIMLGLVTPPYGLAALHHEQHRGIPAQGHRAGRVAVPALDDGDAHAHHLRSRTGALAAAHVRLRRLDVVTFI